MSLIVSNMIILQKKVEEREVKSNFYMGGPKDMEDPVKKLRVSISAYQSQGTNVTYGRTLVVQFSHSEDM